MPTLRGAVRNFHEYGQRTSMHGLSHMYQSGDLCRKSFWLMLTVLGTGACFFHLVMTVRNYLETPVTSVLIEDATRAEFPDVTLCNLKPMSESLGDYYKDVVNHHFDKNWGYFDEWLPDERKRLINESRVDYHRRLRGIFEQYLQIFWVSDDSRDLGMMDKVMLLHCAFNGLPCGHKNFSLVQNYRYWNCYTFHPNPEFRSASGGHMEATGLNLILYTDSNFDENIYNQFASYRRLKRDDDEMNRPYSLREYITTGGRTFNRILSGGRYDIEGIRIWLHMPEDHPMMSSIYHDVQPGEQECATEPHELIKYTTSFGYNSKDIRKREYTKTDREYAVESKQQFIFDNCKCYSHHFPFHCEMTQLCYHASHDHRIKPGPEFLNRVKCHDKYASIAEKNSFKFIQESLNHKACVYRKYTTYKTISTWPRSDENTDFVNEFVLPKMLSGSEFIGASDTHEHHIFNFKNPNITMIMNQSLLSHEALILKRMFNQDCFPNRTTDEPLESMWCLDKEKMAYNVLQIIIRLVSPAAEEYSERFSYEWPEALSEIGGIFGLWVGVSLLTFFEFVELVYLMATSRDSVPPRSSGPGESCEMAPGNLEQLLSRLMEDEAGGPCVQPPKDGQLQQPQQLAPSLQRPLEELPQIAAAKA